MKFEPKPIHFFGVLVVATVLLAANLLFLILFNSKLDQTSNVLAKGSYRELRVTTPDPAVFDDSGIVAGLDEILRELQDMNSNISGLR